MHRPIFVIALATFATVVASAQPQSAPASGQGWTPAQQRDWYYTSQGSRLMPLSWFQALEQPAGTQPFLTPDYIRSFGLLFDDGGVDGLPVGFAANDGDDSKLTYSKLRWYKGQDSRAKWVGLTCSACHTAELEFGGKRVRVDGGPALFDFQSFIEALDAALAATANDPAKFDRFAHAVLGPNDTAPNRDLLRGELQKLIAWEGKVEAFNATPLRYGHGRVDAFGHIFNKVSLFAGVQQPIVNPADAPVSYPFLWDIYRHDKLQWNGIVPQKRLPLGNGKYLDYSALGRNTGEVLGVFGDVAVKPGGGLIPSLGGYKSSVDVAHLDDLETQLRSLRPPRWPGTLDPAMVASGRVLFNDLHCSGCHQPQPGTAPYKVKMVPLSPTNPNSTDPWMACNALSYRSPTVKLKGTRKNYFTGPRYEAEGPLADMLATTVIGTMVAQKGAIIKRIGKIIISPPPQPPPNVVGLAPGEDRLNTCYALNAKLPADGKLMVYKSRPLDGIWATAPYLHNGSVPSLYDLLKAPGDRPGQFFVGTRVYDADKAGYRTDPAAPGNVFRFEARDAQGNPISRNSNEGHDYGVGALSEGQRRALLEYLKSL
jgi:hypothetical protein